ncbi:conserved Plasmodium protein, unknown function [Plasmodium gonderi]|uniref:Uncharacterized protein n=1 Tax=Plasmodium gonderi TaxID=77519 RepID=A0A1Y1JAY1_PLAGO|nr:conserved Plasmodium protein, unknown function [Plasmodium gonderi]GAW79691.1 conserved Plasmodium protein, unknown function [Plasmodium gonderi]
MTKVNKPPTTANPNIKLKRPNSKEEEDFNQPVKKTVIAKNIKVVKKPEDINTTPKKVENESAEKVQTDNDQAKKEVNNVENKSKNTTTDSSKAKTNADNNSQKNDTDTSGGGVHLGYFSWLWRYFPTKKT